MKFNDEHKEEVSKGTGNYFGYGVHKVKIGLLEQGESKNGSEYIEFTLLGDNEEEATARLYFTDKSAKYSFNTARQIYVHNAPEDKKQVARDTFDAVADTDELVKLFNDKLIGGECWFTKYQSRDRTYVDQQGVTRKSIETNIYGWEPQVQLDRLPSEDRAGAVADIANGTVENPKSDAATGIPEEW